MSAGSASRLALAALVAIAATWATAGLSRIPWSPAGTPAGTVLRLSWRVDGVRLEACRTRTEEELAALPAHMRSPQECTRTRAPFALDVVLRGEAVVRDTVFPGGVRQDRPIYVFRDIAADAGPAALSVRFDAVLPEDPQDSTDGARSFEGVRTSYGWEGDIELTDGEILLVTLDDEGTLVLKTPSG